MKALVNRLIWRFQTNGQDIIGYCMDGHIIDHQGKPLTVTAETQVTLWHPMKESVKTIREWRSFLSQHQVEQPFQQVDRAVYTPNSDELSDCYYSTRFASHVLNRLKFKHAITQRGWTLRQKAEHNWSYVPHITLADWDIRVNFFADTKEEDTVVTDLLNFYRQGEPLPLHEVPPVVFSEMIRDIGLFVTTAGTTELHKRP
ncbi:DUF4132 domain-containing protein [Chitinophaga pinensis]|uniref:DUF4132 domain-containing protein n=2 Tax=Chitinophaga pinensis TaxID=79329 RepID=A0A5C6LPY2_9BACT|nr:DUF4132 domain-containing protein [Chitinophaga pinensis]